MGTQTAIAEKINSKRGNDVLAVKENHKILFEEISLYFEDADHLKEIKTKGDDYHTSEKNHGSADVREYYQTSNIHWLNGSEKWKGLKSIGMVEAMHWQLDVTFKEDQNHTLNKTAAENQNIIRKWCTLKQAVFMNGKVKSMRQKRMVVSFNPVKYLDDVLSL